MLVKYPGGRGGLAYLQTGISRGFFGGEGSKSVFFGYWSQLLNLY